MPFSPPDGITFSTSEEVPVFDLCVLLRRISIFLRGVSSPSTDLFLYDDWWQHDGLHFSRGTITFDDLSAMVETPRALFEATPDEHAVFVGIAPRDAGWYLRFRVESDPDQRTMVGSFALTVPSEAAAAFNAEVAAGSGYPLVQEAAGRYYDRVIARE